MIKSLKSGPFYLLFAISFASAVRPSAAATPVMPEFIEQEHIRAPLAITVHADRKYRSGRPIPVKLMITNVSDDPVLINCRMLVNHYRMEGELSFLITGPDGKIHSLTKLISARKLQPSEVAILAVGETREESVDLAEYFGLRRRGIYKVKAVYHNNYDITRQNLKTWQGVVASEATDVVIE